MTNKYKVHFTDPDHVEEVIEAEQYVDTAAGKWVDFLEPDPDDELFGGSRIKVRIAAKEITRIDIVED